MSCRIRALAAARSTCRSSPRRRPGPGASQPSPIRSGRRSAKRRFLVEDYVADRLEFDLTTTATSISPATPAKIERRWPLPLWRAGLGAHARRRDQHRQGRRSCRASPAMSFGLDDDSDADRTTSPTAFPLADLPETDSAGKASFTAALDKVPASTRPLASRDRGAHGGGRRPRRRAQAHASHRAVRADDRGEAAVQRQVARRFRHGEVRRGHGRARRQSRWPSPGFAGNCSASIPNINGTAATAIGSTSRSR